MTPSLRLSEDLSLWVQLAVVAVFTVTAGLLVLETRGRGRMGWGVVFSGVIAAALLSLAVLRPTLVQVAGQVAKARVVVLLDGSHRLTLPADDRDETRRRRAVEALEELQKVWPEVRLEPLSFGEGAPEPWAGFDEVVIHSDLTRALSHLGQAEGQRPKAVVVLSDGRLTEPGPPQADAFAGQLVETLGGTPLHTVRLSERIPRDRSVRQVDATGTAIAHQPFRLHVEVGCEPADSCDEPRVVVRELLEAAPPLELASGTARGDGALLELDLEVTLDRAGSRLIEVELQTEGRLDEVPSNDRRLLPIQVRRDRVRMLHVAGRPTYDVRALRMFLKADESIDLISFFILRTPEDNVGATESELSLIPFPVDELFTEHLPSFDAVILQDIDANTYKLDRHFASLHDYVRNGGGLILVGGPGGFSAGGYADSPVEEVLPVELPVAGKTVSLEPLVPRYTAAGRAAPMLEGVRDLLGERLPEMSGANLIGPARQGSIVLWEHPRLGAVGAASSRSMPLLALAEVGDGRSVALAVDGTHLLRFGRLGAQVAGEAHAALWEGLLGWVMRDPRYEASQVSLDELCLAGVPVSLRVTPLPGTEGEPVLRLSPLREGAGDEALTELEPTGRDGASIMFQLPPLPAGGYAARVSLGQAPPTRHVFACEVGGEAYADSRPDPERLERLAAIAGGKSVDAESIEDLPRPGATYVAAQRKATPVLPPWLWALAASVVLSVHWILRRLSGFV